MSLYFTEEHEFFRKSFQDFLKKEVVPHIDAWEQTGTIDRFISVSYTHLRAHET